MKPVKKSAAGQHKEIVVKSGDVVPIRGYVQIGRRKIPTIRFDLPKGVVVIAYGSHFNNEIPHRNNSVLVHARGDVGVNVEIELGKPLDSAVLLCDGGGKRPRWSISIDSRNTVRGSVRQGTLQGSLDNDNAIMLLQEVSEILSTDTLTKPAYFPHEGVVRNIRIGERILDVIVGAIRSGDLSQIDLLKKAIVASRKEHSRHGKNARHYLPKVCWAVQVAANKHDRVPTAVEVFEVVYEELDGTTDEVVFYRELKNCGFGWLANSRAQRTTRKTK